MRTVSGLLSGRWGRQEAIARSSGVSKSLLSLLKSGKRTLTLDVARRLAEATGTEVVLVGDEIGFEKLKQSKAKKK